MSKKKPKPPSRPRIEPPRLKPLAFEQIMALDEFQIEQLFPHGAIQAGEKWTNAVEGEKPDLTRKGLLRDKRKRQEKLRYMVGTAPQRLAWDSQKKKWVPKRFQGGEEHGYTENSSRALDGSAPVVPDVDQERFSVKGREDDEKRKAQVPLHEELKAIEADLRPQQRAELRRRIEGFKRSAHEKAA